MSAMPPVAPTAVARAVPDAAPAGTSPQPSAAPDFALVLDALLSPARQGDPAAVAGLNPADAAPDGTQRAPGEDQPSDAPAVADPQGLPVPQAQPPAVMFPIAPRSVPAEPGADAPGRAAVMQTPAAPVRGPARWVEPAPDVPSFEEPVSTRAAVEIVPVAPALPAKIAAEPVAVSVPGAGGGAATAPAEVLADVPVGSASDPGRLGFVAVERAAREPGNAVPVDPSRAPVRIDAPELADDVGSRVVWMAGRNQQAAEFRIDPPQLGPVEVRLSLNNDQASLVLLSPHASVRDALQATLPRLHDLLAGAGINLGSVHVGARGHSGGQSGDHPAPTWQASPEPGLPATMQNPGWVVRGRGMVDVYA